jgi:hypothetical protein
MTPLTILAKVSVLLATAALVHAIGGRRVSAAMRHEWWMLTIGQLANVGYPRLQVEELVSLRDQGISPEEVRRANIRAGTHLPVNRLRELAANGWR